ncbi:MFS transporter [Streptosporangiaceae bacterium NEAU-GS5]|nr:MFS transporter [Streptosporangiaceae bacterium NEAU-GS5]
MSLVMAMHRYRALNVAMVAIVMLVAYEYLAVATAMPRVGRELHGMAIYGLAFSAALVGSVVATVACGRWADLRGPAEPLWAGLGGFLAGQLVTGTAPDMNVFVCGRFLQGLGGGLFYVALYVVIDRAYPAELHPRVFSLLAMAWVVPSLVGPSITGLIVEHVGWRWVFLGVPLLAAPAVFILWRGLPPLPVVRVRVTGLGVKLGWAATVAVGTALMQYGSASAPALVAIGVALLVVASPRLLPPGTLRAARGVPAVIVLRGVVGGVFFAAEVFIPLMLTTIRGLTLTQAGLALTGGAVCWSAGSWIQARQPYGNRVVLTTGVSMIAVAVTAVALAVFPSVPLGVAFAAWCLAGLGMGMVYPILSVLILELSGPDEKGTNTAALTVGESVLTGVTVAVTGALFAGFHGTQTIMLTCFALLVLVAAAGVWVAQRTATPASVQP